MWDKVKRMAGWVSSLAPTSLNDNGIITSSPKRMAQILNAYFISKVRNINMEMENITGDPSIYLKNIKKTIGQKRTPMKIFISRK